MSTIKKPLIARNRQEADRIARCYLTSTQPGSKRRYKLMDKDRMLYIFDELRQRVSKDIIPAIDARVQELLSN